MPLAEIITFGSGMSLMALESSLVTAVFRPANPIGLMPVARSSFASSSKSLNIRSRKMFVASMASGEST